MANEYLPRDLVVVPITFPSESIPKEPKAKLPNPDATAFFQRA